MAGTRKKSCTSRRNRTRKAGKSILSRATSPVGHALHAVNKTAGEVVSYAKNIFSRSIKGVHKIGKIWVKNTNKAVSNITRKGSSRSRK
jgi:hypothetical protein